jgi:hypothetical protein
VVEREMREEVERREKAWEERDHTQETGAVDRNEWVDSMVNPVEEVLERELKEDEVEAQ